MKILVFDNYDSFTYNLVHLVEKITHVKVEVHRNDQISLERVKEYDKIVLSPGPGIPEEILESVFYPLVTGRANGTGLGLSIAQNIMHQHNGMIVCHSVAGKTVFSLYLPWESQHVAK